MRKIYFLFLSFVCCCLAGSARQSEKVPAEWCGYWQDLTWQPGSWNGPVITPDYVNFFYQIYYVDRISTDSDGRTTFFLRNNREEKKTLTVSREGGDTLSYRFTGWDTRRAVRLPRHEQLEAVPAGELPAALYACAWTSVGSDTAVCRFRKPDRVRFRGREWRIGGVRRDANSGQYELVLNDGERYSLAYVRSVSPGYLDLASELQNYPLFPEVTDPALRRLQGNWTDAATNEWVYGFYERFAIYRNDFWAYESVRLKKNRAEVVLEKAGERVALDLAFDAAADSVCRIAAGKGKKRKYVRYTSLPDYPSADTVSFFDSGYRTDSVVLSGYFRGVDPSKPVGVAVRTVFTDEDEQYYAQPDSLGRFRLAFPIPNTGEVFIDWGRAFVHAVVEPGEQVLLAYDFAGPEARYMGKNARFHQEMEQYRRSPEYKSLDMYYVRYDAKMPHADYLQKQLDRYGEEKQAFEKFLAAHPQVSARFREFWKQELTFSLADRLMQRRFALKRTAEKERFDPAYRQVVDSLFRLLPHPYSLVGSAHGFVGDYIGYCNDTRDEPGPVCIPVVDGPRYLHRTGRLVLSDRQLACLDTLEMGVRLAIELNAQRLDSAEFGRRIQPYLAVQDRLQPLFADSVFQAFMRDEWNEFSTDRLEWLSIQAELKGLDSLVTDPLLREILTTERFLKSFEHNAKPLSEEKLADFRERVTRPELVEQVMARQRRYEELNREDIRYVESLKRTDHLPECRDADELFARLIEPYRGKVIYVDFWGTWCGPCKEEMSYVGAVKEKLKDRDVVFMYFANRSPVTTWKNIIKQFRLTGPNVVHYNLPDGQQSMLERRLSIRAFPTFILIDRQGRIRSMEAPRPRDRANLIRAIGRLLDEK